MNNTETRTFVDAFYIDDTYIRYNFEYYVDGDNAHEDNVTWAATLSFMQILKDMYIDHTLLDSVVPYDAAYIVRQNGTGSAKHYNVEIRNNSLWRICVTRLRLSMYGADISSKPKRSKPSLPDKDQLLKFLRGDE